MHHCAGRGGSVLLGGRATRSATTRRERAQLDRAKPNSATRRTARAEPGAEPGPGDAAHDSCKRWVAGRRQARGIGWLTERAQDLLDRLLACDEAHELQPAATALALVDFGRERSPHQFGPGTIPRAVRLRPLGPLGPFDVVVVSIGGDSGFGWFGWRRHDERTKLGGDGREVHRGPAAAR